MMPERRQEALLRAVAAQQYLSVEEAVSLTETSPATIRRDFGELAGRGLALRSRGGLRCLQSATENDTKRSSRLEEKSAIAKAAAAYLEPGDVVFVDGGTTTTQLYRYLPAIPLKIITNALVLASHLAAQRAGGLPIEIVLTGGTLQADSGLLVGPQTVATLEAYHAQWAILSASGVCEDGVFNTSEFVAESERVMIRNATRSLILADASKVGRRSLSRVAGVAEVAGLITVETAENEVALSAIEARGGIVHRVIRGSK